MESDEEAASADRRSLGNVQALKMFFQNKNLPIMGIQSPNNCVDQNLNTWTNQRHEPSRHDSSSKLKTAKIHRPPTLSPLKNSTVTVEGYIKVLPNDSKSQELILPRDRPVPKPRRSKVEMLKRNEEEEMQSKVCDEPFQSHSSSEIAGCNDQDVAEFTDGVDSLVINENLKSITSNSITSRSEKKKSSFSSFKNKLISLTRSHSQQKQVQESRTSKGQSQFYDYYVPRKPTRSPPPPPTVIPGRPPAPLPLDLEDIYEDTIASELKEIQEELYNDADPDIGGGDEEIYCSVDGVDSASEESDIYEGIVERNRDKLDHEWDDYYQDVNQTEAIYEVLPFELHNSTESSSGNSSDGMADDMKEAEKSLHKFNCTGQEVPVSVGVVKGNVKGQELDLALNAGEEVMILRTEANPVGKWLVRDNRGRVGYVDADNIRFDLEPTNSAQTLDECKT